MNVRQQVVRRVLARRLQHREIQVELDVREVLDVELEVFGPQRDVVDLAQPTRHAITNRRGQTSPEGARDVFVAPNLLNHDWQPPVEQVVAVKRVRDSSCGTAD